MHKWLRNKVVIWYIVIFILLTLPLYVKVLQHNDTLGKIETALHKLYKDTCHENVEEIVVRADIMQPFSIMPGGLDSVWGASTSSKLIPSVSGHYGKEVISISEFSCSNSQYILDRGKKEFVPIKYLILDTNDNEGIPLLGYYFLILAYFVYISSILIILLVFGFKKMIGIIRNSR